MRIQKIYSCLCTRHSFKSENLYENWHDDYGTYYNDVSIKDAVICACAISSVMAVSGMLLANVSKIKEFCKKIVPSIKKEHFNKII